MTQLFSYEVVYSDGVTVLDTIYAANLTEAKKEAVKRAKEKNYGTSFFKVRRSYISGPRQFTAQWH